MATLIAYQDGNWTGATTWKAIATGTNASMTTTSASTNTTTSYVDSSAFTVTNTEVLEGLLLYCVRVNTTGTVSVALSDDNGTTATREVTVNASDLPAAQSWVFFKFGSTLTADGGSDYKVKVKGSSAGNATFYRDATAGNWARIIRKSDTASIAATDVTYICDELTGAGTKNDITVTMDSTSLSTSYGQVNVGQGGVLAYGTSASTAYKLKLAGNLNVWGGGTFNMGKSGAEIPSTSTAELEFACVANVDFGLEARSGSTVTIYGATKANTKALLTADAASGQKVFTISSTTGWAANDVVALASTTRVESQSEKRTVSTINSGTQATLSTNLSATHHGTAPYVGEVVNLTRNVKIHGTSQTLCAYVNCADTSSFTASYAEFYWLGSSTTSKRGIDSATTSAGTFSMSFCAMYDFNATSSLGLNFTGTSGSPTVEDCVAFLSSTGSVLTLGSTSGTPSIQRNWFMSTATTNLFLNDLGGTIRDNRCAGFTVVLNEAGGIIGTIKDNVQHSASGTGVSMSVDAVGTVDGWTIWRNSSTGIDIRGTGNWTNCSSYHNATSNIDISTTQSNQSAGACLISNSTFNGGSGASLAVSTNQIRFFTTFNNVFDSCTFGNINTASNFIAGPTTLRAMDLTFRKCTISDTVTITNQSNLLATQEFTSAIKFDKFNNTSGSHRAYKRYGRTEADQATYKTAAPSEALLPSNASNKLPSGSKKFAVASGTTATVTVYVNKSATYNGNQPTLIVKANSIAGIASDTVLATASGGTGSWLTLSGTTATVSDDCVLEVYVDCDGTAGTVYVDDWSIS